MSAPSLQPFIATLVQMTSSRSLAENLSTIDTRARAAADAGASLVCLPETCTLMEPDRERLLATLKPTDSDPTVDALCSLAHACDVWLSIGSHVALTMDADATPKAANRSLMINPMGEIVETYDKIHLFDVDLDGGETYRESNNYKGGDRAVIADTPLSKLGMTVCYDLRFPGLYRDLAKAGADILLIPSAFTRPTGEAHWEPLLRARAIENGCYVLAAAQCGEHEGGRRTWGHSMIIDPWGKILADGGQTTGLVSGQVDLAQVTTARSHLPSLRHGRSYEGP